MKIYFSVWTRIILLSFFLFYHGISADGQEDSKKFVAFGIQEGLPEEFARGILQDELGFIWVATQNGVVKYNGYNFENFKPISNTGDQTSMISKNISRGFFKGRSGKIWMAGTPPGISYFDPEKGVFQNFKYDPNNADTWPLENLDLIEEDITGKLWFNNRTSEEETKEICYLDPQTQHIKCYPYDASSRRINDFLLNFKYVESIIDSSVWLLDEKNHLLRWDRGEEVIDTLLQGEIIFDNEIGVDTIEQILSLQNNHFLLSGQKGLYIWDPEKQENQQNFAIWEELNTTYTEELEFISFEDKNEHIWVSTYDGRILIIDPKRSIISKYRVFDLSTEFANQSLSHVYVLPMHQTRNGIWLRVRGATKMGDRTTFLGMLYYHHSTSSFQFYNRSFNTKQEINMSVNGPRDIFTDHTGLIWFGNRPNFFKEDPKAQQMDLFSYDPKNEIGLFSDTIYNLFEDSQERMWVGTNRTIGYHVSGDVFEEKRYRSTNSRLTSLGDIYAITQDGNNRLWVCSDKGLFLFNERTQLFTQIVKGRCITVLLDSKNRLWVIKDKDILVLNGDNFTVLKNINQKNGDQYGLSFSRIRTVFEDSKGVIWLGDHSSIDPALHRYSEQQDTFYAYASNPAQDDSTSISSNEFQCFIEDDLGRLWIGTDGGLNLYDRENEVFQKNKDGYNLSSITGFSRDTMGKIWVTTYSSGGLCLVGPGIDEVEVFGEEHGLVHNDVRAVSDERRIVKDDFGNFWLPTQRGLSVFNVKSRKFTNFFTKDGFQEYGRGYGVLKRKNGEIWIGGQNGLNRIDPQILTKKDTSLAKVHITGLKILDRRYTIPDGEILKSTLPFTDEIKLEHWQKDLSFEFVALHYLRSEDNMYSYKLENYDQAWSEPGKNRTVGYTNLDFGTYVFKVKASNADGIWNNEGAQLKVIILPPWWRTWWAYVLYGLVLLWLGREIHKYQQEKTIRVEKEKAKDRELAQAKEIEKAYSDLEKSHADLKNTQAQLIHSEKMASLGELTAGIAHEIQNPLNFVNNFSEVSSEMVTEANEELIAGDIEETKTILKDLKGNLDKINHHGKRADSIVKGMLMHSRASNGEKILTDINALCDEFLRLSYHGLRAKDRTFNAEFETRFDQRIPKIEIVPQDIGRVLLNLINNAFQACSEVASADRGVSTEAKPLTGLEALSEVSRNPKVIVETKLSPSGGGQGVEYDQVQIVVSDNGPGIPDEIKDKIFQPFFTTRPTGQGTGLGLSLSYDIVKAHGGEINVISKEGEGTKFIINLPY